MRKFFLGAMASITLMASCGQESLPVLTLETATLPITQEKVDVKTIDYSMTKVKSIKWLSTDNKNPETPPIAPITLLPDMPSNTFDEIHLMVRTNPVTPENERLLHDWRLEFNTIDDQGRATGPTFYGATKSDGNASVVLPASMFEQSLVIRAKNEILSLLYDGIAENNSSLEIFVPAQCYDKAIWLIGPLKTHYGGFIKKQPVIGERLGTPAK